MTPNERSQGRTVSRGRAARRARWTTALVGALCASLHTSLHASTAWAEPPSSRALSDDEVSRRIAVIQGALDRATPAARLWWGGWYAGYLALSVGQASLAIATHDRGRRADMAVGAFTSSLGLGSLGVFGFEPVSAAISLRALGASTPAERRRKLAQAEHLLKACAEGEAFGRSWVPHALGLAVNGGAGLLLAFHYDRGRAALFSALAGVAIAEIQIFTQPTAAIDDWNAYVRTHGAGVSATPPRPTSSWAIVPLGAGLGIARSF